MLCLWRQEADFSTVGEGLMWNSINIGRDAAVSLA